MASTVQGVRNLDLTNRFANVSDARIQCIIDDVVPCYVNAAAWGTCADLAGELVACHELEIGFRGGSSPAGPVSSESAGGVSVSYASPSVTGSDGYWTSSTFGQKFLALKKTRLTTPIVAYGQPFNSVVT